MDKLKELVNKRNSLWEQMQAVADGGFADAAQREEYSRLETEMDANEAAIASEERHIERAKAFAGAETPPDNGPDASDDGPEYNSVFEKWLRHGITELAPEERSVLQSGLTNHDSNFQIRGGVSAAEKRALGTLAGQAGGFTVPEGFWNQIVEARKAFGGLRNAPTYKLETGQGNDIPVPTDDETGSSGAYIGENGLVGEQDISFGQKTIKAFTVTSKIVRVPFQLLQDSAFNIEAHVAKKLGQRIGRAEAAKFAAGTGLEEPEGILTAAPVGYTVSGTNSFAYADFVEFVHSVDPDYRNEPSVGFVMSDDALKAARLITISSADDRPLWQPGLTVGAPNTILEYSYWIDNGFDAVASGNTPAVFGALDNFWIRDVMSMQLMRLDERYAEYGQVAFLAFARNDSKLIDAGQGPIKSLKMS